jgi:uncharacterized phage infection (PIP) family protein YhgE
MPAITPIGAHADQLAAAGVPLPSIVSMIESHYAAALKEMDAQLKEAIVGTLQVETLKHALNKETARTAELQRRLDTAVDRASALQNFQTPVLQPQLSPAAAPSQHSAGGAERDRVDDTLLDVAVEQSKPRGTQARPIAAGINTASVNAALNTRLHLEQLQRSVDTLQVDLREKSSALDRERHVRRRLEGENHVLNMHAMGLHDEISRLTTALETTRHRLREGLSQFDNDRQSLLASLADVRSELVSTVQRRDSEVEAMTSHTKALEQKLRDLGQQYAELRDDYNAATNHCAVDGEAGSSNEPSPVANTPSRHRSPKAADMMAAAAAARGAAETVASLHGALQAVAARATAAEAEVKRLTDELDRSRQQHFALARSATLSPMQCSGTARRD